MQLPFEMKKMPVLLQATEDGFPKQVR